MRLAIKCEPDVDKLALACDVGFQCAEVYTTRELLTENSVETLTAFPLEYVVHAPVNHFDRDVVEFASRINAKGINTHKIIPDHKLVELLCLAQQYGMFVTVENEGWPRPDCPKAQLVPTFGAVNTPDDWKRQREQVPGLGLCVDVEHALIRGVYPALIKAFPADVKHIHLTGYINEETGHHRPIQENVEQTKRVADVLKSTEYKGFVICEYSVKFHTREVWGKTYDDFRAIFGV